jgi:hypothetical protein
MSTSLEIMIRNLKELEKRKAMHGPGEAPLFLLSQIAEQREQIIQETGKQPEALALYGAELSESGQATREESQTPEPASTSNFPFVMQVLCPKEGTPQVQVQRSKGGDTGPQPLELPYEHEDLALVMKALATPVGKLPAGRFDPDEMTKLENLGMVESGYLLERMYQEVGRDLYQALFPPEVAKLFHVARSQAQSDKRSLALRLIFDVGGAALARYPWELIHDDVPLVADGVIDLTRYVAFPRPCAALKVNLPLRVLGIAARPSGLPALPSSAEPRAVATGLAPFMEKEALGITWLSPPTRSALLAAIQHEDVHIIHFDGHGSFGRLCPACHILHKATSTHCTRCQYPLSTVGAQGYLAFENKRGKVNYVSARSLANALSRNRTQVVVLSACRSGQVGGGHVFNGVGPALIQAGVPAVVAMQLPVPVNDAVRFARAFYAALADFSPLVEAVGRGRQELYNETCNPRAWFIPTLYLRSEDPYGYLFHPTHPNS